MVIKCFSNLLSRNRSLFTQSLLVSLTSLFSFYLNHWRANQTFLPSIYLMLEMKPSTFPIVNSDFETFHLDYNRSSPYQFYCKRPPFFHFGLWIKCLDSYCVFATQRHIHTDKKTILAVNQMLWWRVPWKAGVWDVSGEARKKPGTDEDSLQEETGWTR